ncbi:MAG: alpha/beta fold hydrolase [Sphaerotilus natans subsp. sulfidivorans]|uniref:alpha/beta fold hydrolase n=1 Tax=Sphaerotilus sulfidivorans TaxID=639200 RepID=UPI0023569DF9|nr:alpha/beta fold hydrolase [Sphaerotilus sulfidivorans]MCK6400701.1 alpha/beta fold hydrolase [Sphaerotilus sulfidivorans]
MTQDRFIDVGPIRTRYWQAGSAGSTVVLLHGIGCSVLEWERNLDALASKHRVFAVDLLGFGLTDKPQNECYGIRRLAAFVLDFMSAHGIQRAHLAGNSLGGRLALDCAVIAPHRVVSLLLVDPAGVDGLGTLPEFRLATVPLLGELFTRPTRMGTRMLWNKAFAKPGAFVTEELVRTKVRLASLPGAQSAFLETLRSFVGLRGFRAELVAELHAALPAIQAPTLTLWGGSDRFVPPAHAQTLKRLMPTVEVQVWEDCGHVPQIECSPRFNAEALGFWERVDKAQRTSTA